MTISLQLGEIIHNKISNLRNKRNVLEKCIVEWDYRYVDFVVERKALVLFLFAQRFSVDNATCFLTSMEVMHYNNRDFILWKI